jgi:hypothetical protein
VNHVARRNGTTGGAAWVLVVALAAIVAASGCGPLRLALDLKGLATPVAASEVHHRRDEPAALLAHTPFVGRAVELAKLTHHLQEAEAAFDVGRVTPMQPAGSRTD